MIRKRRFDTSKAMAMQRRLATKVVRRDRIGPVRLIGGCDVSFHGEQGRAAVVVLDARTLKVLETRTKEMRAPVPYIPGLLTFREVPLIIGAFRKLTRKPDLLLVDGMGLIHPRRCGIACHLGLALDLPTIGCGKKPFVGEFEKPHRERGSWSPVVQEGEVLGAALRTRDCVKPLFVSTGHRVSLRTAIRWILRTAVKYRLPEPIRAAHCAAGTVTPRQSSPNKPGSGQHMAGRI